MTPRHVADLHLQALANGVDAAGRVEHVAAKLRQQQKGARPRSRPGGGMAGAGGLAIPSLPMPDGCEEEAARKALMVDPTAAAAAVMNDGLDAAQVPRPHRPAPTALSTGVRPQRLLPLTRVHGAYTPPPPHRMPPSPRSSLPRWPPRHGSPRQRAPYRRG